MAVEVDLTAYKHAPFLFTFVMLGYDWSAATFAMEARTGKGEHVADPAPIALANATAGSEGISASYDANYIDGETCQVVGATIVTGQIDKATLEALDYASNEADGLVLYYDMHVTPSGEATRVWPYGTLTVEPGVTV